MLVSQVVMPANDAIVKLLTATLPFEELAWARFTGNFLLLLPLAAAQTRGRIPKIAAPGLQILRGLLIVASNLLFIAGVAVVPLADALALVFVAPLVVAALSPWFLGEPADARRWLTVVVGFLGALVILRPGFGLMPLHAVLPLCAGVTFALYLLITRKIAGQNSAIVTQTVTAAIGMLVTTFLLPSAWVMPTATEAALLAVVGVLSCLGHLLITKAHDHADASVLAPFTYLCIVTAVILGWSVFGDLPDRWTIIGAGIVIASGLAIWLLEQARRR